MPKSLSPIPVGVQIVDKQGAISTFFRLRWEDLRTAFQVTPTVAAVASASPNPTAAVVTTAAYTTISGATYRVSWYVRKTIADGVASSLTLTLGWTESGVPLTEVQTALVLDTTAAEQSGSKLIRADAASDLTFAWAYASTTPNKMAYLYTIVVEQMA